MNRTRKLCLSEMKCQHFFSEKVSKIRKSVQPRFSGGTDKWIRLVTQRQLAYELIARNSKVYFRSNSFWTSDAKWEPWTNVEANWREIYRETESHYNFLARKLAHRIGSRFLRNKIFEQSSFLNKNSVEKNDLKFHRNEIIRVLDRVRKKQTRGRK